MDVDLRTLYDDLPGAIIVSDSATGRILDCNTAAEKLTGRSRSEMIGMHHAGLLAGNNTAKDRKSVV